MFTWSHIHIYYTVASVIIIRHADSLVQPIHHSHVALIQPWSYRPPRHRRNSAKFMSRLDGENVPGVHSPSKSTHVQSSPLPIDVEDIENVGVVATSNVPIEIDELQIDIDTNQNGGKVGSSERASNENVESIMLETFSRSDELPLEIETVEALDRDDLDSQEISKPVEQIARSAPPVSKIIKFAVPAIGVWLCGPILSLIDTSAVGLLAGTKQQAGLNPGVAICDYTALLIAFMYTATTNLVASAREDESSSDQKPRTAKTLVSALQLSGFVGAMLGSILILTSKFTVRAMIGNDAIDPEVFNAARKYVNIRALGMPAAAIIGSAQAACLGMQDIKSPLYVLFVAAVINFIGDACFVGRKAAWLGGAAGAAWATAFSQYAALFMFIKWLTVKARSNTVTPQNQPPNIFDGAVDNPMAVTLKTEKLANNILELTTKDKLDMTSQRAQVKSGLKKVQEAVKNVDTSVEKKKPLSSALVGKCGSFLNKVFSKRSKKAKDETFTSKGFLAGQLRFAQFLSLPPLILRRDFYPFFLPVTATSVGRVSAYIAMAHVVASTLGTLSMAAQQIITSVFYCLCPIADSLSLTAQSFVPGIHERSQKNMEGANELKETAINFVKTGAIFGVIMSSASLCIPLLGKYFTSDASVIAQVFKVAPILAGVFIVHGILCACEGVMLGQKDLNFLGRFYTAAFFTVPYFMLRLKKVALAGNVISLKSVWGVFLCYNWLRAIIFIFRVALLTLRQQKRNSENLATADNI